MSFKKEWLKWNFFRRVITTNGPGTLIYFGPERKARHKWKVKLDEAVAGRRTLCIDEGELSIESDFSLVRVINTNGILLSNAQNYLSWDECLEALTQPFSQDESLIALNFIDKKLELNRPLKAPPYQIIETYIDMYWKMNAKFYETLEEAMEAWKKIDMIGGTSGHILLCTLVSLDANRILARALFTTAKVIKKEVY